MILYVLKQNKNRKSPAFGKHFAYPVIEETIELDGLAEHMSNLEGCHQGNADRHGWLYQRTAAGR